MILNQIAILMEYYMAIYAMNALYLHNKDVKIHSSYTHNHKNA